MLLQQQQQQSGTMNVQLPQVQQATTLTGQIQQASVNSVHSGSQQLTVQQQAPPPQQSLQQQTNTLAQVGHAQIHTSYASYVQINTSHWFPSFIL